jgi:hypothetical protein
MRCEICHSVRVPGYQRANTCIPAA